MIWMRDLLFLSLCPHEPCPFLPPPAISSVHSAALSVRHCTFPDSFFIATRAKLVLCTSAGILKLHHGIVVRNIHSTSPSLSLPQNWTKSPKTVVLTALVVGVNVWHITERKLFWKWHSFLSGVEMYVYVNACFPECFRRPAQLLYVGSKDRVLRRSSSNKQHSNNPRQ